MKSEINTIFDRIDDVWFKFTNQMSDYSVEDYEIWIPQTMYDSVQEWVVKNHKITGFIPDYASKFVKIGPDGRHVEPYDGLSVVVMPRGSKLMRTKLGQEIL